MVLAVAVAMYAALSGQYRSNADGTKLPSEVVMSQQAPIERTAGLEPQLPVEQRTGERNTLQVLPSLTELKGIPAPQITTTAESRVESLNRAISTTPTPTPVSAKDLCEPSSSPAYCIYTVREGDTLGSIALEFGLRSASVPGWELLTASNKPDIVSADQPILVGQKLRVPVRSGVVHTVILDETVGDLAELFDVTSASIIQANGLSNGNLIGIGQTLLIPDPNRIPSPEDMAAAAEPSPTATETPPSATEAAPTTPDAPGAPPAPEEPAPEPTPEPVKGFIWPITATVRITNYFSARHPLGIDMGLGHAPGSPVVAVAPGKVVFAGGDACCSYGYYVIVDHENGLKTLYAHLRTIHVSVGQRVSQGQTLGPSGSTGYSTGVHLHFEVHKNGTRVDPIPYLPR